MSLEGKLSDLSLPDIFQILSLSKRSGILTILRKEGTARLVFSHGNIVYASSDNKNRLGYTLVNKGIITTDELENALKLQSRTGGTKPLGTILIETQAISKELLQEEIIKHICIVVGDILKWNTGTFHFEIGDLVKPEFDVPLQSGVSSDYILLEAARINDEEEQENSKRPPEKKKEIIEDKKPKKQEPEGEVLNSKNGDLDIDDMKVLTSMIAEISGPSNRSEITLMVLRYASELMNRAVLFMVKKSEVVGLGQFGVIYEDGSESDKKIRGIAVQLDKDSIFKEVVDKRMVIKKAIPETPMNNYIIQQLGGKWPVEAFAAPIITDEKVVAILYGDNLPEAAKIGKTGGLEAFINVAGVSLGKTLLERKLKDKQNSH